MGRARLGHPAELEEVRAMAAAERQEAASAQDALDAAVALHREQLDERDRLAAHSAATHAEEVARLCEHLDEARTAVAAADARAEAAAEDANRQTGEDAANTEASLRRVQVDLAKAQAAVASVTTRAETAERLLEHARAELQAERDRNDVRLSQLHEQLAQLIARNPARHPPTKRALSKKKSTTRSK
jgi:chromosome segregation ATPase